MVGEWCEVMLEDVAEEVTVGHVGPMASEYVADGIPFLRSQNIEPLRINYSDLKFINPAFHDRLKKSALSAGDVVIVRTGKPGACAIIPKTLPVANCSDLVIVRCGALLDPRFLTYYVNSEASHHVNSHLVGAVQQHFNVGSARKMIIRLPGLSEQRAIAHILGTLDDKIELNRKINETLDAIARSIFKKWFVDATGSGLPRGWRETTIGELCEFAYGKALKEEMRRPGLIPVYGSNGQVGWHDQALVKGPGVVIGRKGNPGIVTWSPTDFFPIDTTFYVMPKGECRSMYFLYYAMQTHDFAALGADSAVPGLNRNMAYMSREVIPPQSLLDAFDKQVRPIFDRIYHNTKESRTLAALRDALLPKLMTGEMKVRSHEN